MTQGTFSYTYDNNGNITEIRKNNSLISKYTYDEMNQLVREDNYLLNKTYIFTYDTAGNILSKKTYNAVLTTESGTPDATIAYTYATSGWKDQLVSFGGESIVYDVLGNPTTYRGHSLTWGKLRQLNSFDNNTFTYNAKGIRTGKNNISYTLDGTKILSETRPTGTIQYLYGASGVIGFTYNGNTYYYEKNIQGDVTAIVNASGTIKAKYTYDAWGNHTITLDADGIGTLNPIRYRSYYYDVETGLYYLQSRYYDPAIGRFINADKYISTGTGILGSNMYAYCNNNPIIFCDKSGTMRIRHVLMSDQRAFSKPQTTSTSNQLWKNPHEDKYNDPSFDNVLQHACQQVYVATQENNFEKEHGTTIFQIPYDSEYYVDEAQENNYWMSDVYSGTEETIIHNVANLDENNVEIVAYIHSHCDWDERPENGGFSGKDLKTIPKQPARIKHYVITREGNVHEYNPHTGLGNKDPIFSFS